jgi:hypothetical protein
MHVARLSDHQRSLRSQKPHFGAKEFPLSTPRLSDAEREVLSLAVGEGTHQVVVRLSSAGDDQWSRAVVSSSGLELGEERCIAVQADQG